MRVPGANTGKKVALGVVMSRSWPARKRYRALQRLGLDRLGPAYFSPGVYISDLHGLYGPGGCFINTEVFFDNGPFYIGRGVNIAARCVLLSSTHLIGPPSARAGDGVFAETRIEEGCWIGAGATIMPGITIGEGCVIGAGAVVTHDCEPNGLYLGVPARRVRDLPTTRDQSLPGRETE